MKQQLFNELNSKGEIVRSVSITEDIAKSLNTRSEDTGLTYKAAKAPAPEETKAPKAAKTNKK